MLSRGVFLLFFLKECLFSRGVFSCSFLFSHGEFFLFVFLVECFLWSLILFCILVECFLFFLVSCGVFFSSLVECFFFSFGVFFFIAWSFFLWCFFLCFLMERLFKLFSRGLFSCFLFSRGVFYLFVFLIECFFFAFSWCVFLFLLSRGVFLEIHA